MMIESYNFGRIKLNNTEYTSDVIIFPDRVLHPWWRKEGHLLHIEDIEEVLNYKPEILIIGTGYSGVMRVPAEIVKKLQSMGIQVVVQKTTEAVKTYNSLESGKKVAALHLTC
jgi:hypothetical protein